MQPTTLLTTLLLPLAALSAPIAIAIATPGEIAPNTSGNVRGTSTWYCTWSYELAFDHYVLEGHKWGVSEQELRALIPGTVTAWDYQKIGEEWSDFKAKVCLDVLFLSVLFLLLCVVCVL